MRIVTCVMLLLGCVAWAFGQAAPTSTPTTLPSPQPVAASPAGVPSQVAAVWKQLEPRRAEAVRLARAIEKGQLDVARRNYGELMDLTRKFNELLAPLAEASPLRYGQAAPRNGFGRGMWLYKASRDIERYNVANKSEMSAEEFEVLVKVNEYREALGLLPLEWDSRLGDSARGHSRWMADTKEFSHDSGLPGLKTHGQRMEKAGYKWTSAGENIAYGTGELNTAAAMFKGWFDSPGHHRTMVGDYTHIGVGHVDVYWTQNFGTGEPAKAIARGKR